jgi:hypothetical protein
MLAKSASATLRTNSKALQRGLHHNLAIFTRAHTSTTVSKSILYYPSISLHRKDIPTLKCYVGNSASSWPGNDS